MNHDIYVCGIATWDTLFSGVPADFMQLDGITAAGYSETVGGDAVNTAVSLSKLGIDTVLSACVGRDAAAAKIESALEEYGIDPSGLYHNENCHTAAPAILIDEEGERHLLRVPGNGNMFFSREMINDEILKNCRHLHIGSVNMLPSLDGAPLAALFEHAHSLGITTSMDASGDPSGKWLEKIKDVLPHCDIFIPSLQEAKMYAGSDEPEKIAAFFSQWPIRYFGVKLGAAGVYVTDFKNEYRIPTLYKGKPVDTTGAGDAFCAGFLAGYLKGYDLPSCAYLGSAQSASVMRAAGATTSAGTMDEALTLIRESGQTLHIIQE